MENALPLFALAAVVAAGGLVIGVLATWWLRAKQLDLAERGLVTGASLTGASIAGIEARLVRIEQIVESTAVEVERIAEAQRFTSKLLAEQQPPRSLHGRPAGKP